LTTKLDNIWAAFMLKKSFELKRYSMAKARESAARV
jgi:hypothetical protein